MKNSKEVNPAIKIDLDSSEAKRKKGLRRY